MFQKIQYLLLLIQLQSIKSVILFSERYIELMNTSALFLYFSFYVEAFVSYFVQSLLSSYYFKWLLTRPDSVRVTYIIDGEHLLRTHREIWIGSQRRTAGKALMPCFMRKSRPTLGHALCRQLGDGARTSLHYSAHITLTHAHVQHKMLH